MPSLIAKHQEKQTVTALKKFYSVMSQAFMLTKNEMGSPENWDLKTQGSSEGAENLLNALSKNLKIIKKCGRNNEDCFSNVNYNYMNGTNYGSEDVSLSTAKAVLSDGIPFAVWVANQDCARDAGENSLKENCATIHVDINGKKGPNIFGHDMFIFYINKNGITPSGVQEMKESSSFENDCNINKAESSGAGCAAWVIFNENMDYLHCDDLSWTGKTKCD